MLGYIFVAFINLIRIGMYAIATYMTIFVYLLFLWMIGNILPVQWLRPDKWEWLNTLGMQFGMITLNNEAASIQLLTLVLMIASCVWILLPMTEWIYTFRIGATKVSNSNHEHASTIQDIYDYVCQHAGINPNRYTVYIDDNDDINAYAIGYKTIIVNTGFLDVMSPNALAGVLGHEMGHIVHQHTLVSRIINGIVLPFNVLSYIVHILVTIGNFLFHRIPFINLVWFVIILLPVIFSFLYNRIVLPVLNFIDLFLSRRFEYQADNYACKLGYKDGLIEFFEAFLEIDNHLSWWDNLWSTHPLTRNRLKKVLAYES